MEYTTPEFKQAVLQELEEMKKAVDGVLARKKQCEDAYAKEPSEEYKLEIARANQVLEMVQGQIAKLKQDLELASQAQIMIAPKEEILKWLKKGKVPRVLLHLFSYWKEGSEEHTKLTFIQHRYNDWTRGSDKKKPKPAKDDEVYNGMKKALTELIPDTSKP